MTDSDMTYDSFERSDADYTADTFGLTPGVAAVYMEHHAAVFCPTCAEDILGGELFSQVKSDDLGYDHPKADELGNVAAVLSTTEWDCPGPRCDHCGVGIDVRVTHYDAVCQPDTCPNLVQCGYCEEVLETDELHDHPDGKECPVCGTFAVGA